MTDLLNNRERGSSFSEADFQRVSAERYFEDIQGRVQGGTASPGDTEWYNSVPKIPDDGPKWLETLTPEEESGMESAKQALDTRFAAVEKGELFPYTVECSNRIVPGCLRRWTAFSDGPTDIPEVSSSICPPCFDAQMENLI